MAGNEGGLGAIVKALVAAEQARESRRARGGGDLWVTPGVNWGGYSLESLVSMVATDANPAQLEALADRWRQHGRAIEQNSEHLRKSLEKLLSYWSGAAAEQAGAKVLRDAAWIGELGRTTTAIADPIEHSAGALRSAQSTMPGVPHNRFSFGGAAGGAAAGFVVGGPFGAAAGAVLGGFASAFGFGTSKKKLKRKAVQTMSRFEGALVGIDAATPGFRQPTDDIDPGGGTRPRPPGGIDVPAGPPGVGPGEPGVGPRPGPQPPVGGDGSTLPSFASGETARWQALTGLGAGGAGGTGLGGGSAAGALGAGAGAGQGLFGPGNLLGGMRGGLGQGGRFGAGAGRFGGLGAAGEHGYGPAGAGARKGGDEDDKEHRRRYPFEDDLFDPGVRTPPPVIGL